MRHSSQSFLIASQKTNVLSFVDFLNLKKQWIILVGSVFLFLVGFYLYQIFNLTHLNFLISQYQKEISKLSSQIKSSEIEFSKKLSLNALEEKMENFSEFERVKKIYYVQVFDENFAKAQK